MTLKTMGPHPDHGAVSFAPLRLSPSVFLPSSICSRVQDALAVCLRAGSGDRDGFGR